MKKLNPESKFFKVRCPKCKAEQIVFEKASTNVNCLVCNNPLAAPTGGKARLSSRALEILN
jgi:small subunit ribosomal protein S27e